MLDGERMKPEDTPKFLELEDNDQIDVMLETVGGYCSSDI
jgi:antibiotic biosynthesis monooxygenase (ABM) superfamily enzyme